MPFRFYRSIGFANLFRINFGKKNVSLRIGPKHFGYTIGTAGKRFSAGIPGTGLGFTHKFDSNPSTTKNYDPNPPQPPPSQPASPQPMPLRPATDAPVAPVRLWTVWNWLARIVGILLLGVIGWNLPGWFSKYLDEKTPKQSLIANVIPAELHAGKLALRDAILFGSFSLENSNEVAIRNSRIRCDILNRSDATIGSYEFNIATQIEPTNKVEIANHRFGKWPPGAYRMNCRTLLSEAVR